MIGTVKDVVLELYASTEHLLLIDKAAEIAGQNTQAFMMDAVLEKARTVTKAAHIAYQGDIAPDQVSFVLNETDFIKFVGEITAPYKRNPGLDRLKSVVAPWDIK